MSEDSVDTPRSPSPTGGQARPDDQPCTGGPHHDGCGQRADVCRNTRQCCDWCWHTGADPALPGQPCPSPLIGGPGCTCWSTQAHNARRRRDYWVNGPGAEPVQWPQQGLVDCNACHLGNHTACRTDKCPCRDTAAHVYTLQQQA